jgi:hypothetical protein
VTEPHIKRLAGALTVHTKRSIRRHARSSYHGIVRQVDPLLVDIVGLDGDDLRDADEITIGDALATRLAARGGLEVEDTLTLVEVGDDDYIAVEVLPG